MHVNRKQCSRTGPHVASPYSPPLVASPSPPLVPLNFSTSASPPVLYIFNNKANNLQKFTKCRPAGKMISANESMEFKDTELTLGLPGTTSDYNHPRVFGGFNFKISSTSSSSVKRGFMDTVDQISLQKSSTASEPCGSSSSSTSSCTTTTSVIKAPAAKARIAGWPPVRSMRQKSLVVVESSRKYVKVSADGAPYLRKLDLEMYKSYQELLKALEQMFPSLTISGKCIEDGNEVMQPAVKGMDQYVLTYEDKDGDWMLVGDVPWKMFIESCKRIRLTKSSDAVGIAPRAQIPSDHEYK